MGPQRKHPNFFTSIPSRRNKPQSGVLSSAANLSDSSIDPSVLDSDMPPESIMDMSDIQGLQTPTPTTTQIQQRKAWAWNHGFLDDTRWQCKYCSKSYDCSAMTHPNAHLAARHNIKESYQRGQPALPTLLSEPNNTFFTKRIQFKPESFRACLVDWILQDRISFHEVERQAFRDMVASIRPEAVEVLQSANTIRADCMRRFEAARQNIKYLFAKSKSKIHISADLWTSPNNYALLGVVAHWWDEQDMLRSALIALPKLYGAHTGANIGKAIIDTLDLYEITEKVGYFMLDNASSNDTAVDTVVKELRHRGISRTITAKQSRLRCTGHIINLVVKSLFFGTSSEALEMDSVEFESWRRIGPTGKLHNIIRRIRVSPQRRERFLAYQGSDPDSDLEPLMVRQNNDTRWNSTFEMIHRALKPQVRRAIGKFMDSAIEEYSTGHEREELEADRLEEADWAMLEMVHEILEPFHSMTQELQGNIGDNRMNGAIFDVLPCMDFLLQQLETAKETYLDSPILASCINLAWTKLNKYYEATDDSTVYATAVMLDPRLKLQYFDRNWKKCWIETAELHFKRLVRDYSGATNVSTANYVGHSNSITPRPILSSWKYKEKCNTNKEVDELKEYFKQ